MLAELGRRLDTGDRDCRSVKAVEIQASAHAVSAPSAILLNEVIRVLVGMYGEATFAKLGKARG
jgi:hypothetical protein